MPVRIWCNVIKLSHVPARAALPGLSAVKLRRREKADRAADGASSCGSFRYFTTSLCHVLMFR